MVYYVLVMNSTTDRILMVLSAFEVLCCWIPGYIIYKYLEIPKKEISLKSLIFSDFSVFRTEKAFS